eukprot:gene40822-54030_t
MKQPFSRGMRLSAVALAAAVLSACGGGGGGGVIIEPPLSCSVRDQQLWLDSYMDDWYYWYAISPNPSPNSYADVASYFDARLYQGTDPTFPKADVWSNYQRQ